MNAFDDRPTMLQPTSLTDGGRLAVFDHGGTGPDVVLCHGANRTQNDWQEVLALLDAVRPVTYDLRGHGMSDAPRRAEYGWSAHVEDLARVIDGTGLDRPLVIGHSLGGMIATEYAARGGSCRGVVNLDGLGGGAPQLYPGLAPEESHRRRHSQIEAYATAKQARQDPGSPSQPGAEFLIATTEAQDGWSVFEITRQVRCPVLIVRSGQQPPLDRLPAEYAELAAALIRGIDNEMARLSGDCPSIRQVMVPAAGHLLHLQVPHRVVTLITRFLADTA